VTTEHAGQAEPYLSGPNDQLLRTARSVVQDSELLLKGLGQGSRAVWMDANQSANAVFSNRIERESRTEYITAHIASERAVDMSQLCGHEALLSSTLLNVHGELYSRVSDVAYVAGAWRTVNVSVQNHVPPSWPSLAEFLKRTDEVYARPWKSREDLLLATAAAHHRLAWIHPFTDGNGRAIRLQSQLALRPLGSHFWSLSEGLWRRRDEYYARLGEADMPRLSDLDGRGNLSKKMLDAWCTFFIDVCHEEIRHTIERM
jgi:Fic family protein